jgi:hypothetical protein
VPQVLAAAAEITFDVLTSVGVPASVAAAVASNIVVIATVAISVGMSVADMLNQPTPEGQRLTVRQAIPSRRRGVGVSRTGGQLLLDEANTTNDLYRVHAIIDGIGGIPTRWYLGQDRAFLGSSPFLDTGGVVLQMPNGGYTNNCMTIQCANGVSGTPAFTRIAGKCSWGASDYGTGIFMSAYSAYGGSLQNFTTCYPRGKPELNLVGPLGTAFDWRDVTQSQSDPTTWKNTANPIVGLVHELWAFRGYDWTLDILPALDILTAEANVCDVPVNYLNVLAQTVYFTTTGNSVIYLDPNGPLPWVGVTIYVGGQMFTVNSVGAGVTVGGYFGIDVHLSGTLLIGVPPQFTVRWQASPSHPVTEPTYACGGVWSATEREADTVKKFVDSCDGFMERRGSDGALIIRAGHYIAPTVTLGPDEIISYVWDSYLTDGKVINELTPAVVHPAFDYTQVDTTALRDDDDVAVNGLSTQPFKPDFVTSNGQVMRLARRRLDKLLKPTQSLTTKRSGLKMLGERFIALDFGDDLPSVVVERVGRTEVIDGGMAVQTQVREVDPATIDTWDCYSQEGDGPSATSPPGGPGMLAPAAPTIVSAVTYTTTLTSGANGEYLKVVATPPANYVARTDLTWIVQWQVAGDAAWSPRQTFVGMPAGTVTLDKIGPAPYGATLNVQVAYQTGGGQLSAWATSGTPNNLTTEAGDTLTTEAGVAIGLDPS